MEYVLETHSLIKQYRRFRALDGVDMRIERGAIYGFVGRNGAGKTTLIRLITGLQEPTGGEYILYGERSSGGRINRARRRVGAVVETPSIYLDMSAEDNIKTQYRVLGVPDMSGAGELLELVGLDSVGRKRARHFSLGMKQRLGIAVALAGDPDFLILDEPVNGLDPQGIIEIRELILRLNRERQITVLISSHILSELSKLATHYGFIDKGRIVREISAAELEENCRKCVRVTVSDISALSRVLELMNMEYSVVSDKEADVYGQVTVTELALALSKENCTLISLHERDESLESFYVRVIGGGAE